MKEQRVQTLGGTRPQAEAWKGPRGTAVDSEGRAGRHGRWVGEPAVRPHRVLRPGHTGGFYRRSSEKPPRGCQPGQGVAWSGLHVEKVTVLNRVGAVSFL